LNVPLEDLDDTVVLYGPRLYGTDLYPTPLFLFRKHRDNTTLDRQLRQGSVLLVTAHARDEGRESPFDLR
jgi:hypothetical protein